MPTIEFELADLEKLVGKKLHDLASLLEYAKAELEQVQDGIAKVTIEDSNRPDLWAVEGLARVLKGVLGLEIGLKSYIAEKSNFVVKVDKAVQKIRPYIACAVVKGIHLNDYLIRQLMQTQEKIDGVFGRGRKKTSIGVYEFDKIAWPLKYTVTKPNQNAFVPLGFTKKMSPAEILRVHPKGIEYGHLISEFKEYPILLDGRGKVLSMPPIINSEELGHVKEGCQNILIEVTGTNPEAVNLVLTILCTNLADRGGKVYSVKIAYPDREQICPDFDATICRMDVNFANRLLGSTFSSNEFANLLMVSRYGIKRCSDEFIEVFVPCYRKDIMHQVDLIEDVAIAFGYQNFAPASLSLYSVGGLVEGARLRDKLRELCIGLGMQEIFRFVLSDPADFERARLKPHFKVANPVSETFSCLRSSLIPSLLTFLAKNKTKEFPQKIFELGEVVIADKKADTKSRTEWFLAFAISHANANYTEAKQHVEAILRNIGVQFKIEAGTHPTLLPGRIGKIIIQGKELGVLGEVHPEVLNKFGLEMPVVLCEIRLDF